MPAGHRCRAAGGGMSQINLLLPELRPRLSRGCGLKPSHDHRGNRRDGHLGSATGCRYNRPAGAQGGRNSPNCASASDPGPGRSRRVIRSAAGRRGRAVRRVSGVRRRWPPSNPAASAPAKGQSGVLRGFARQTMEGVAHRRGAGRQRRRNSWAPDRFRALRPITSAAQWGW